MIKAYLNEPLTSPLKQAIKDGKMTLSTNFVDGVDDLIDAYWAFQTMIRENHYKVVIKNG
jgi:hypothetical protein